MFAGALGLLKREPLSATMQKLAPLWDELVSLPPQQSIEAMIEAATPHLKTVGVMIYSLAPHFVFAKIREAIDEATNNELSEARVYLRQVASAALTVRGARAYYRRIRRVLTVASTMFRSRDFRGRSVPRWTKRFQDLITWEGLAAFATFSTLRVGRAMSETDAVSSKPEISARSSS
jgi:hypothetical protein